MQCSFDVYSRRVRTVMLICKIITKALFHCNYQTFLLPYLSLEQGISITARHISEITRRLQPCISLQQPGCITTVHNQTVLQPCISLQKPNCITPMDVIATIRLYCTHAYRCSDQTVLQPCTSSQQPDCFLAV